MFRVCLKQVVKNWHFPEIRLWRQLFSDDRAGFHFKWKKLVMLHTNKGYFFHLLVHGNLSRKRIFHLINCFNIFPNTALYKSKINSFSNSGLHETVADETVLIVLGRTFLGSRS